MDIWDEGYRDGFRDAMQTVRELADEQPDLRVNEVFESMRDEHDLLFTPAWDPHRRDLR